MMMHTQPYFGVGALEKKKKILRQVKKNRFSGDLYILALPLWDANQLDIYPSFVLLQPFFRKRDLKIVGFALGKEEAFEVTTQIAEDIYMRTGELDFRRFFETPGSMGDDGECWLSF